MKSLIKFFTMTLMFLGLTAQAMAASNEEPTKSVTTNSLVNIGIYPNTEAGIIQCFHDLDSGKAIFYQPVDTRGYIKDVKTNALEDSTCARMRVRGGLKAVAALRAGSLVNIGMRDGREQPIAYNECNNWLELLNRPVEEKKSIVVTQTSAPSTETVVVPQTQTEVSVTPTETVHDVIDTVTIRRRTVVRYEDEIVYETPPQVNVMVPPTEYKYVERPRQNVYASTECICYRPAGYSGPLYQYRYPNGQRFCVPPQMGDSTIYPPGYGPN